MRDHTDRDHAARFSPEQDENDGTLNRPFPSGERFFEFQKWFLRMRWIACIVAADLVVVTVVVLKYLDAETLAPLLMLVGCIAATNVAYSICLHKRRHVRYLAEIGIYLDLVILTAMLHYSGGIENPISFLYVFHVIIAGMLLNRRRCFAVVAVASTLYAAMAFAEMAEWLHHYTLEIFPHPEVGDEHVFHVAHQLPYVSSMMALQVLLMSFTAYFTTTIMARLRIEEQRAVTDRRRLDRVVQAAGAGLALLDKNMRVVWLNDQMKLWAALAPEDVLAPANRIVNWVAGEDGPAPRAFKDGKLHVVERQIVGALGGKRYFQITVAPLFDSDGDVYQVVTLAQDVTDRKIVEAEMVHSAKMASLGLIAAGIAHEIGNPLASISTRLRLMEGEHDQPFLEDSIRLLQGQIGRIDRIVRGVSQFARPVGHEWTVFQVSAVVAETVEMLRLHSAAKDCHIETELEWIIPEINGVKDQFVQVFMNLGLNALETMPHGGTLTVRSFRRDGNIRIEFADNGEGMDEDTRAKLFVPFFSTKDDGMGLGLCIAQNLVQSHGGHIEVESSPGAGSVFTIVLPIQSTRDSLSPATRRPNR